MFSKSMVHLHVIIIVLGLIYYEPGPIDEWYVWLTLLKNVFY